MAPKFKKFKKSQIKHNFILIHLMVGRDTNIIIVFKLSREIFIFTLYFLKLIEVHKINFCLGNGNSDIT